MIRSFIFAIVSGGFFYLSFAPHNYWPLSFLGAALLFFNLIERTLRERSAIAFLTGLAFFLPLLQWSGSYVGSAPWLILSMGESVLFALVAIFRYRRKFSSALLFSATFTLVELLRMKFPFSGFGWGRIGFAQLTPLSSIYRVIGITGATFLTLFISTSALVKNRLAVLVVIVAVFFSLLVSRFEIRSATTPSLSIAAVQGGVDQLGLGFNDRAFSVLNRHIAETKGLVKGVDLVVWPENSSDIDPIRDTQANEAIKGLIAEIKTPLLVGAVEETPRGPSNSSLLFDKNGEVSSRYVKQELAPFGEYIPLRPVAEAISKEAKNVTNFVVGKGWTLHHIQGIPFASLICFEIVDDDLVRGAIAKGANFLVAQTNNATFGRSAEADQQLQITRARAAELGREIVVVSTTGHTAELNKSGQVVTEIPQFDSGVLLTEIHPESGRTFASRVGSGAWSIGLFLLMGLGLRRSVFSR